MKVMGLREIFSFHTCVTCTREMTMEVMIFVQTCAHEDMIDFVNKDLTNVNEHIS